MGVNWDLEEAFAPPWSIANYAIVKHVISLETLCCIIIDSILSLSILLKTIRLKKAGDGGLRRLLYTALY